MKVVQELLRPANSRITLDLYAQAGMCRTSGWHKANLFGWCSPREKHWPNWTMTQIANSLQVLERIGGDDGTRTRGLCRDRAAF